MLIFLFFFFKILSSIESREIDIFISKEIRMLEKPGIPDKSGEIWCLYYFNLRDFIIFGVQKKKNKSISGWRISDHLNVNFGIWKIMKEYDIE